MEKRFVLFIILTMIIIVGYNFLVTTFGPKKPIVDAKKAQEAKQVKDKEQDDSKKPVEDKVDDDAKADSPAEKPDASEKPAEAAAPVKTPHRIVSLGSYDPNTASPLLVTFNSRGGALERVELVGRDSKGDLRYRDLDNMGGYLGNLSLVAESPSGSRVQVVPAGTPAALAQPSDASFGVGLKVGDLILSINDKKAQAPHDLEQILADMKPGQSAKLSVEREVDGQTKAITFTATLDVRPFQMIRPEPLEKGDIRPHPLSMLLAIKSSNEIGSAENWLHQVEWEIKELPGESPAVELSYRIDSPRVEDLKLAGPVEVVKRYRLGVPRNPTATEAPQAAKDALLPYHLDFEVELRNLSDQPQKLTYTLDGMNGLPTEGWWYLAKIHPEMFAGAGARDVVLHREVGSRQLIGCPAILKRAKKDEKQPDTPLFGEGEGAETRSLRYIGVDTQYFAAALLPALKEKPEPMSFARGEAVVLGDVTKIRKGWERTANVSFELQSLPIELEPNGVSRQEFSIFTGPKEPQLLAKYDLGELIYYGWFGSIAQVLAKILHFFHHQLVGNYGIAIIMLTVLVRACMFPISRKAAKNAAMMQELAPEMKKIAEKYKNNMEARGKAQQELFKKHNYNPLSGCWMMFLQLPVFMGLYRCLAVDIELRQAPLIPGIEWASNLAGPDKFFFWKSAMTSYFTDESGWLGPYFNLLPIFTIGLFLLQQKLFTPPATDEQTAMQMKMMKFMTVIMGVLFYKVPAGLCVYFITSSLWGIAERKLLPKPKPPKPGEGGSPSLLERIMPKPDDQNGTTPPRKRPANRPKKK